MRRLLTGLPWNEALELQLYRAGLTMSVPRFLGLSVALGLAGSAVGYLLFGGHLGRAGACAVAGFLPYLQALRLGKARMALFEQQFPDAVDLLIRALRAGHTLSAGFQMAGEELPDPIGTEFAQVADEIQLGQFSIALVGKERKRLGASAARRQFGT